MQTILGSGGPIATELAKALTKYTSDIRLVSRNPQKVNEKDVLFKADLLDKVEVLEAVKGSSIVYLTVGFTYSLETWQESWPLVMQNVIDACKEHSAKLVFFDNIYMYDKNHLAPMDEETPINPPSKKGKVREQIAQMLLDEVNAGSITALIARSADFYGPSIKNTSLLTGTVFQPLFENKKANWIGNPKYKHSFTYTPDAGRATALLGNTEDSFGEIWHLPTADDPFTGKEWVDQIAAALGKKPKIQVVPKFLLRFMGLFNPIMQEVVEMYYQYDRDYIFDSSKFEKRFNQKATAANVAINEIVSIDYS